jgi:sialic acid synthase SpsE
MSSSNEHDLKVLNDELEQVEKIIGEITEKTDALELQRKRMTTLASSFRWMLSSIKKGEVQIPLELDASSSS